MNEQLVHEGLSLYKFCDQEIHIHLENVNWNYLNVPDDIIRQHVKIVHSLTSPPLVDLWSLFFLKKSCISSL
jgi:hypothetical protein